MNKTGLGDRMKDYESRARQFLPRRTNTIIRIDGKAFHTYTKGLDKPFDEGLIDDMQKTAIYLCQNIPGVKCAYTQSDEITLLLTDYDTIQTQAWFDGNVQKICSIGASYATSKFYQLRLLREWQINYQNGLGDLNQLDLESIHLAEFDSRCFTIADKEEVVNQFLWRQQDAERNSIQMLAQFLYSSDSSETLHKKGNSELQELCFQKGHNWNDLHYSKKRGSFIVKNTYVNKVGKVTYKQKTKDCPFPPCACEGDILLRNNNAFLFSNCGNDMGFNWTEILEPVIRNKWEVIKTPMFGKNREVILNLMKS